MNKNGEIIRDDLNYKKLIEDGCNDRKEEVIMAVSVDGYQLKYASDRLKGDFLVVLTAIHQEGHALIYASEKMKSNKQIVLEALKYCYLFAIEDLLDSIPLDLRNDPDVIKTANEAYDRQISDSLSNVRTRKNSISC